MTKKPDKIWQKHPAKEDYAAAQRYLSLLFTEAEVRAYYENRKSEFKKQSEFPDDIFAGDPGAKLTPPQVQPFED